MWSPLTLVCGAGVVNARLYGSDSQRCACPLEDKTSEESLIDGTIQALRLQVAPILDVRWQSVRKSIGTEQVRWRIFVTLVYIRLRKRLLTTRNS